MTRARSGAWRAWAVALCALLAPGCGKAPELLLEEGDAALEMNLLDAALERYREVEQKHAEVHPEVFERIGDVYARKNDGTRALRYYDLALEHFPDKAKLWNKRGAYLVASGSLDLARASFEAALKHGESFDAHFNLGVLDLKSGDPVSALERYSRAKELAPENASVDQHLGLTLMQLNRHQEGAGFLAAAWRRDPEKSLPADKLLALLIQVGRWRDGAEVGAELAKASGEPLVLAQYAYCLWRAGGADEARRLLQSLRSMQLSPAFLQYLDRLLAEGPEALPPPRAG